MNHTVAHWYAVCVCKAEKDIIYYGQKLQTNRMYSIDC